MSDLDSVSCLKAASYEVLPDQDEPAEEGVALRESFATTLRRRRARKHSTPAPLQWRKVWDVPSGSVGPTLRGALAEAVGGALAVAAGVAPPGRRRVPTRDPIEADLGRLREVCRIVANWHDPYRAMLRFSEAVTPNREFLDRFNEAVLGSGIGLGCLDLAFSEEAFAIEDGDVAYSLAALRDHGVNIWLSGFGGGTSSLTTLRYASDSGLLDGVLIDLGQIAQASFGTSESLGVSASAAPEDEIVNYAKGTAAAAMVLGLSIGVENVDSAALYGLACEMGAHLLTGSHLQATFPDSFEPGMSEARKARRYGTRR